MWDLIESRLTAFALKRLPQFILRKIFKVEQLKKDIEIDLRSGTAIRLNFNSEIPNLSIWLRITNKTATPITIDRILFDVWFGQPLVTGHNLSKFVVNPKQTKKDVCLRSELSMVQQDAIRRRIVNGRLETNVSLNCLHIFCDSKLGPFEINLFNIEYEGFAVGGVG